MAEKKYSLTAVLNLKDKMTQKIRKPIEQLNKMRQATDKATTSTQKFTKEGQKTEKVGKSLSKAGGGARAMVGSFIKLAAAIGAVTLAVKLMSSTLGGAMKLEQEQIAMEHFIGLSNPKEQAKQLTDEFIGYLRQNANLTPFSTDEVISAGRRAVNVSGGDLKMAKELLTISENMAALNPGKTVMDAMEALADLKVGEAERMKEFGFKISAEQMKSAGAGNLEKGAMKIITTDIAKVFDGGAEKLAQSGAGMLSTITGNLESGLTDMGVKALEKLKPQLQMIIDMMNSGGLDKFIEVGSNAIAGLVDGLAWAMSVLQKFMPTLKQGFSSAGKIVMPILESLKDLVMDVAGAFMQQWPQMSAVVSKSMKNLQPIIGMVVSVIQVLGQAVKLALPLIMNIFATVMPFVTSVVGTLAKVIQALIVNVVMPLLPYISSILTDVWNTVKPLFSVMLARFKAIAGAIIFLVTKVVKPLMPVIGFILVALWKVIKLPLMLIVGIFTTISKIITGLVNGAVKLAGALGKVGSVVNKAFGKLFGGGDDDQEKGKSHAAGLSNVPYDGYAATLHKGERVLTKDENRKGAGARINIAKLADQIVVREEADIERIAKQLAQEIIRAGGLMANA